MRRLDPDANARLTATTGLTLIVLSLAEIATLLLGLHSWLSWHVAIGLALLPPIALKLGTTGWRFMRYYTRNVEYRAKGAPQIVMRLLAPLLVFFTVVLFGSGIALGLTHGTVLHVARRLHGPAAVGWMVTLGLHTLVYLGRALREATARNGAKLRAGIVGLTLVAALVVGVATIPTQHHWLHLHSRHDHDKGRFKGR
ncbi:MAG TPA: hypothetical protein VGH52_09480 [Gaiellaceae bacterium]